jgi:hypothetical protein
VSSESSFSFTPFFPLLPESPFHPHLHALLHIPQLSKSSRIELTNSAVATSSTSQPHNKADTSELPIPIHRPSPRRRILFSNRTIDPPLGPHSKNNRSRFKRGMSLRRSCVRNGPNELGN